ncbi:MAG: hypothetical protein M3176_11525 [Chloroflexota bacterium]|nr:hypothetical protein [Chloroflexota bacterium]
MRRILTLTATFLLLVSLVGMASIQAASSYADPQFDAQWKQGEAITPNFWGPLANAKDGQDEAYKEATGGKRKVQYFDKGRMELTGGKVTNGLLASEVIKGQIQNGDATFQGQPPPAIAIAGDPTNTVPTYATLATKAVSLLGAAQSKTGSNVTATISATTGDVTAGTPPAAPETTISAFDTDTKHNVPKVLADYRDKAGLQTIGLAISEPFRANVKVGGKATDVMIQVFERRVLTYTASNPDAFKVEMGNIGQHYYQWRYPSKPAASAPASASPSAPAPAPSGPTTAPGVAGSKTLPTPVAPAGSGIAVTLSDVLPTVKVGDIQTVNILTNGKIGCAIDVTYAGNKPAKSPGLQPRQTDEQGKLNFTWTIGPEAQPGNATIAVSCLSFGATTFGTANASFSVSG